MAAFFHVAFAQTCNTAVTTRQVCVKPLVELLGGRIEQSSALQKYFL